MNLANCLFCMNLVIVLIVCLFQFVFRFKCNFKKMRFDSKRKVLLIDYFLENDCHKPACKWHYAILIKYLSFNAILYLLSAASDDRFVDRYIPTILISIGVRGPTRRLSDLTVAFILLFVIATLINYNLRANKDGFQLFKALKKIQPPQSVSLTRRQLKQLRKQTEFAVSLCRWSEPLIILSVLVATLILPVMVIFPASTKATWYLVVVELLFWPMATVIVHYFLPPVVHLFITTNYFLMRINKLNTLFVLADLLDSVKPTTFDRVVLTHNAICKDIVRYSQFWKIYYFFALIFMIPSNLFVLHTLVYEHLPPFLNMAYFAAFVMTALYIFLIGTCFARIAYGIVKTRKQLNQLISKQMFKSSFRNWIKLMNCVERVSNDRYQIGFTCLTIFTVTYETLFHVSKV